MSEFDAIAIESLGLESLIALFAFGIAALLPGRASERLGLGAGRLPWRHIGLLAVGTLAASAALDGLIEELHWKDASSLGEFERILAGVRGSSLAFGVLAFAVLPGFAEELLCRGLIQRSLVARIGPFAGIAIASVAFGLLHIDPVHALFATPLGLYLGIVCHFDDGIRAGVVCHVGNNLVALLAGALLGDSVHGGWPGIVLGAVIAVAAIGWVARTTPPRPPSPRSARQPGPAGGPTPTDPEIPP